MRSKIEQRVYDALTSLGSYRVQEQYPLPERLRVDFVISELRLAVETDGRQHEEFNIHFYDSKADFEKAKQRDKRKEELCKEQNLVLVRLKERQVKSAASREQLGSLILELREKAARKEASRKKADW